mmetsp:Transcript_36534/g.101402  ORF Transcript_36534/g.101402 Transcript_36534/m.101402 type:complete len:132 (-) Transcript_36534:680-1075(-)
MHAGLRMCTHMYPKARRGNRKLQDNLTVLTKLPVEVMLPALAKLPVEVRLPVLASLPVEVKLPVLAKLLVRVRLPVLARLPVEVRVPLLPSRTWAVAAFELSGILDPLPLAVLLFCCCWPTVGAEPLRRKS